MSPSSARSSRPSGPLLGVLVGAVVAVALCCCQTYEAVTAAPTEFWGTLGGLLKAVWADIWSIIDLVL